jgi:hypothetical protein
MRDALVKLIVFSVDEYAQRRETRDGRRQGPRRVAAGTAVAQM